MQNIVLNGGVVSEWWGGQRMVGWSANGGAVSEWWGGQRIISCNRCGKKRPWVNLSYSRGNWKTEKDHEIPHSVNQV